MVYIYVVLQTRCRFLHLSCTCWVSLSADCLVRGRPQLRVC